MRDGTRRLGKFNGKGKKQPSALVTVPKLNQQTDAVRKHIHGCDINMMMRALANISFQPWTVRPPNPENRCRESQKNVAVWRDILKTALTA